MRTWWIAALGAVLAAPAAAEMYKCQAPDGTTLYTSNPAQCPGAEVHEPKGQVQSAPASPWTPPPGMPAAPGSGSGAGSGGDDDAAAAMWRSKRHEAEQELAYVTKRLVYVRRAVGLCNRGADLWVEDDAGIRRNYPCSRVHEEKGELERSEVELRAYLDGGLEEECRRAGCLPGWIR